ncbi:MAG: hypothetical protein L6R40_000778 [Gallowayella cf. fulva]|nr:MAG: hypothetical protein L6R40_000778 [Xanthomendoza cf. fulva]
MEGADIKGGGREYTSDDQKPLLSESWQSLPLVDQGQLKLRDVELILATWNRRISAASSLEEKKHLSREREQVLGVLHQLNAENLRSRAIQRGLNQWSHDGYSETKWWNISTEKHTPQGRYVESIDRCVPAARPESTHVPLSIDRYIPPENQAKRQLPTDGRYRPDFSVQDSPNCIKRRRDPSPEEDTEVMAEVITQVNRLTKRVAGLQEQRRPEKRVKGAAEGLSVALLASVEELLAKAEDATGYHR